MEHGRRIVRQSPQLYPVVEDLLKASKNLRGRGRCILRYAANEVIYVRGPNVGEGERSNRRLYPVVDL